MTADGRKGRLRRQFVSELGAVDFGQTFQAGEHFVLCNGKRRQVLQYGVSRREARTGTSLLGGPFVRQ